MNTTRTTKGKSMFHAPNDPNLIAVFYLHNLGWIARISRGAMGHLESEPHATPLNALDNLVTLMSDSGWQFNDTWRPDDE